LKDGGSGTVLIVAHQQAQEVDGVIDLLRKFDLRVARWNLCEYPERSTATATRDRIRIGGAEFDIPSGPNVAWIHDTGFFSVASSLRGRAREVAIRECQALCDGVLGALNCKWLNEPDRISAASSKILQLRMAGRLGIRVPNYCITNDPAEARRFVRQNRDVVVKAVRGGYVLDAEGGLKFFTRRLADVDGAALFDQLACSPIIFQAEIERRAELRVTVVDGECFSMEIDCRGLPSDCVDVRQLDFPSNRDRFRRAENQKDIERWSCEISRELQLAYAGLDWAISKSGVPYFLECNPLGAFKWSELCTKYDISGAIARALYRRVIAP